jgi:hypothetical protein
MTSADATNTAATDPYYIRSYYTSTSLTISFTDILKELADFLVRRDYVTQALDFLALACCRSFEYLPNLIKLAEAQGTPVLTKIMKWVLRHSRQGIPAGDALLWAERFQEQRLTDLALHMACFFIARAPSAAQRDVDWVFKLGSFVSLDFSTPPTSAYTLAKYVQRIPTKAPSKLKTRSRFCSVRHQILYLETKWFCGRLPKRHTSLTSTLRHFPCAWAYAAKVSHIRCYAICIITTTITMIYCTSTSSSAESPKRKNLIPSRQRLSRSS